MSNQKSKIFRFHLYFILILWTHYGIDSTSSSSQRNYNITKSIKDSMTNKKQATDTCYLYLAPSSIPHSGFGIYTTRDIGLGESINLYLDSPSIPLIDKGTYFQTHKNFVWGGNHFSQYEADYVSVAVPNWSSHCNYHTYLYNFKHGNGFYNDSMANRFTDPSAGAFSYHTGFYYKATRTIIAGEELFAHYGESWLDAREGSYTDLIPREQDFEMGGKILNTLFQFKNDKNNTLEDVDLYRIQSIVKVMDERIASLLPPTIDELDNLAKTPFSSDLDPMAARLAASTIQHTQHHLDWIYKHGLCMDHVRAGPSTIPLAGQGAFAARFLSKGDLITPTPLLHVMETYEHISNQLIVNYCFGHERSNILLCPMSSLTLMNHCSTRRQHVEGSCDPAKGPNAEIRWATDWHPTSNIWLNMTLNELHEMYTSERNGLAFDVIALRDIQPDEEIFIDYGKKWEDAWEQHARSWVPPERYGSSYSSLLSIIESGYEPRTVQDLTTEPYPHNVIQVCFFEKDRAEEQGHRGKGYDFIIEDGSIFTPVKPLIFEDYVYQCDMLRNNNDGTCTVVVVPSLDNEYTYLIMRYPLAGITFRPKPYSSDQHLKSAFRHYISIRDDIFPIHWLSNEEGSSDTAACSLYLAPSSIPDAGYGVYTTKLILPGQSIITEDSPVVIVSNSDAHNKGEEVVYAWGSRLNRNDQILSFNIGALANFHTVLNNMKPHTVEDSSNDHFSSTFDPSQGAYTNDRGYDFVATETIFPGGEIFANYGDEWLDTRSESFADNIPRLKHYDQAVAVLKTIQKESDAGRFPLNETSYSFIINTVKSLNSLVAQTLPITISEMNESIRRDDDEEIIKKKLAKRSINVSQHTVSWVKENGLCIDNIKPGKSTIPLAGQGAFASRFLANGSLIAPAPLVQIPDRNILLMYELIDSGDGKKFFRKNDIPVGSQLLLNYCFGHKDSKLLLYPLTNVILINHCSSRMFSEGDCGLKGPNAKVQWSWESHNQEWLNKSIDEIYELTAVGMRGLSFDIIATRDIQKGEEIFIDYGVDWEKAWENHVHNWNPQLTSYRNNTFSSFSMSDEILEIRTLSEQRNYPYPDDIVTLCYYDPEVEWVNSTQIDNQYIANGNVYQLPDDEVQSSDSFFSCEILEKQGDDKLIVKISDLDGLMDRQVILNNYPASSITFRKQNRSLELKHVSGSFRHAIGVDDEMWPSNWKKT